MPFSADALLASLSDLPSPLVAGTVLVFMALETMVLVGLVAPGDPVVLVAGAGVTSAGEFALILAATLAGALIGESGGYLVGRTFGDRFRYSRMGRWIGEERWEHAEEILARPRGGLAIVGSRFVAVVHAVVPVLAGTVGMPYRRFIAWAALGSSLWALLHVGLGALFRASYGDDGEGLGGLTAVVLVGGAVLMVLGGRRPRRRAPGGGPAVPAAGAPETAAAPGPAEHPDEAAGGRSGETAAGDAGRCPSTG
ncbi:DedA family protein [Marinitenerispora sediminis]|uniref:DedA family protein n=1 Tax=Marinitenerispora sediminis TaxID=1931232 RepID=A0A368SXQ4_9ACTN|nr:VTT domain-containing protein [Marinitenerispora sediminis]RCV47326.1 DedA family protein [Marinitenerispora sediminis]RCV47374.1 DedA family protein [Marinitenerispora sediminis]RCV47689.1 DedA family protein [Marinitenerispora sediminis]